MSHDLSRAQNHAFNLACTLMVPVTLFQVDGEYGVLPSDEIDDGDDLDIIHEYTHTQIPTIAGRLIEPASPLRKLRFGGGACAPPFEAS